ncbi:hypothetical protein [Kutzneria kofuensis]|uniref:Uncharacterized protein n=1 Tax=Kutzneria kofuensis TaxID=103725 RepID=A0A7W9KDX5_9PSEU|nr:hypothetical protein [Kutzneria kofuensis]MBB5890819.1 hypothetical protein [Kutzneria kofuensis]
MAGEIAHCGHRSAVDDLVLVESREGNGLADRGGVAGDGIVTTDDVGRDQRCPPTLQQWDQDEAGADAIGQPGPDLMRTVAVPDMRMQHCRHAVARRQFDEGLPQKRRPGAESGARASRRLADATVFTTNRTLRENPTVDSRPGGWLCATSPP